MIEKTQEVKMMRLLLQIHKVTTLFHIKLKNRHSKRFKSFFWNFYTVPNWNCSFLYGNNLWQLAKLILLNYSQILAGLRLTKYGCLVDKNLATSSTAGAASFRI